jgi:hypothetical protein
MRDRGHGEFQRFCRVIEDGVEIDVDRRDGVIPPKLDSFVVAVHRKQPLILERVVEVGLQQNYPGKLVEAAAPARVPVYTLTQVDEIIVDLKERGGKTSGADEIGGTRTRIPGRIALPA